MPDSKITALTSISTSTDPANDPLVIVDVSDTSMAATGTTKKVTLNQLLGAGGTATLASATISGDLTVDTNVLKVDTVNNRVGVNTASPLTNLHVGSGAGLTGLGIGLSRGATANFFEAFDGTKTFIGGTDSANSGVKVGSLSNHSVFLVCNNITQLQIDPLGVFSFTDGAGGTRMTLNSTGLGVGASPTSKLTVRVAPPSGNADGIYVNTGTYEGALQITGSAYNNYGVGANTVWLYSGANNLAIGPYGGTGVVTIVSGGSERFRVDTAGNVGIGVTPSAWSSGIKVLEFGTKGGLAGSGSDVNLIYNAYYDGSNKYRTTDYANNFQISGGQFKWLTAPSGTAGNVITYTQAMTLDASGRLGVGTVPVSNTRTHFKGSSTSTDYITFCVNSSDKLAFGIRNDGLMITGPSADSATLPNAPYNLTSGSAANVFVDSQGIFFRSTSSLKYKTDIADSTRGLADVLKLRPVTYKAKNSGDIVFGGLIAEEVDAAGLTEFVQYAPDKTPDAIHYGNMVSLLVAAIKELTAEVNALKNA